MNLRMDVDRTTGSQDRSAISIQGEKEDGGGGREKTPWSSTSSL